LRTVNISNKQCRCRSTDYCKSNDYVLLIHCISDINLETDVITCPVPYGGMLLLNNLIPHRRYINYSSLVNMKL